MEASSGLAGVVDLAVYGETLDSDHLIRQSLLLLINTVRRKPAHCDQYLPRGQALADSILQISLLLSLSVDTRGDLCCTAVIYPYYHTTLRQVTAINHNWSIV